MKRIRNLSLLASALVLVPVSVLAQPAPTAGAPREKVAGQSVAEMGLPQGAEAGDAEARRKALNEQQAQAARAQVEDNVAREQAREAAIATETARQDREQAAYAEAVRQHDAAVQDYQAARTTWERANPACKRNDPVKCPR
ncbi:hypothetical protein [Novosphingobium sp. PhB55]|uniref:hypothetical protein n=1 Tax=unclassified Novosphingobium TaxID=2644732 RepID=UPI00106510DF|nr:hypothetical protein [Novosphingobium sp. PhB55]TDW67656.1 hypothetical protein EDF57_102543 [Novosphingobium sp. PhB55]